MDLHTSTPAAPELSAKLGLARSGAMQLPQLLDEANSLVERGLREASAQLYAEWIANTKSPMRHVACFNWGTVLGALGRHDEAEAAYRQAIQFAPGFAQALLNLGHIHERRGEFDEALRLWQQVVDHSKPSDPFQLDVHLHAINNLARVNEQLRRFDVAESFMRRSLEVKPTQFDVIQHYVHIRQKQCEWPLYQPVGAVTPNHMLLGTSALAMLGINDDPALQLLSAQRFAHERIPKPPATPLYANQPPRQGRVKIAYLSGDLHMHAVGLLTAELLELHDRSRFEVYGFCWSTEDGSPLRARLRKAMDQFVDLKGVPDARAAELIAAHGIDVVIDLQGLTNGARPAILGYRGAPIQVSYLGLPATSSVPGVDWIIADRFVMPGELRPFFTEQPIYLPRCYQSSDRQREVGPKPQRSTYGLPDDAFVFCSFNNNFKFTEALFKGWMRILQGVPGSVLWLLADNPWSQENMLREADAAGVARNRLIFAPRAMPPEYLARLQLADLFLDTFPYNAGTTASDALWMGLPILTHSGRSYISRMAGSLLTHVGLPDLITDSQAEYERRAIELGRNPARVASYKRYLAEHGRSSSLFDMPAFVRDYEAALETMALTARAHGPGALRVIE